jgi:hypothetical protein
MGKESERREKITGIRRITQLDTWYLESSLIEVIRTSFFDLCFIPFNVKSKLIEYNS